MPTLFTRIIEGEIPGHFIHRDSICVVFLTINPISRGHALVVPIQEVDQWTDLAAPVAQHLFAVAQQIGIAQRQVYGSLRIGMIIAGFEIPHCHLHVIPANEMSDLSFERALPGVESSALIIEATALVAALATCRMPSDH
ncbi:MAG: HIT family protein [Actinobacteria bacterium]|nr:MAG: HIT family protein [Actinomycetota bacterium]